MGIVIKIQYKYRSFYLNVLNNQEDQNGFAGSYLRSGWLRPSQSVTAMVPQPTLVALEPPCTVMALPNTLRTPLSLTWNKVIHTLSLLLGLQCFLLHSSQFWNVFVNSLWLTGSVPSHQKGTHRVIAAYFEGFLIADWFMKTEIICLCFE